MNRTRLLVTTLATAAVMATPALALAGNGHNPHGSTGGTGTTGSTSHNGNAFGVLCAKESRVHVAGQQGTPFSQCVNAMAKEAGSNGTLNPAKACAALSHRHVRGVKGTPFSRCVVAAAHLRGGRGSTGGTGQPARPNRERLLSRPAEGGPRAIGCRGIPGIRAAAPRCPRRAAMDLPDSRNCRPHCRY